MAINRIDIILNVDDRATKSIKRFENQTKKSSKNIKKDLTDIALKAAAVVIAFKTVGNAASAFVNAAAKVQQLQTRLTVLTGTLAKGNELFEQMATLAGNVPFTYDEIMESAVNLRAVVKEGNEEVTKLMPIILDLAATTGLGIQETTGQMIRMYSAGAGAADLFRERGVLAMLGFQAGVSVSAEETMDRVIAAWEDGESRFRGATDKLADTWIGRVSMMQDAWFKFKAEVGGFIVEDDLVLGGIEGIVTNLNLFSDAIKNLKEEGVGLIEMITAPQFNLFSEIIEQINQTIRDREVQEYADEIFRLAEEMGVLKESSDLVNESIATQGSLYEEAAIKNAEAFDVISQKNLELQNRFKVLNKKIESSFATTISSLLQGSQGAEQAFKQLGKAMVGAVADFIAQMIVAATVSKALKAVETKAMVAMGADIATAMAPAALAANVATLGGAGIAAASSFGIASSALIASMAATSAVGLADGGIVKARPGGILAQIGEGGQDEAVIPLDSAGGGLGFGDINIFIEGGISPGGSSVEEMAEELGFAFENEVRTARGF